MARRNLFDRAREFITGTVRKVRDSFADLVERVNDPIDNEELTPIIDFDDGSHDENQPIHNEANQRSDEQIAEDIIDSDPPTEIFSPEGDPDEDDTPDEEYESEFAFEFGDFGDYHPKDLRRLLSTFSEAVEYARDITLPSEDISIIQDRNTRLFRVLVEYELVISE